ncbi:hypothetical protein [Pararobbsia alpina]|uniref:Lipoprotein n=1 Tax=Pararobbsia alpina TaxID=621374 RepID=A0A6S7BA87_9BURK|nr:hypothetical protein [Pararobbsia alpina]CAB3784185.1 hypothetical protein LMG28138_01758 [Pararobbsia alpina]
MIRVALAALLLSGCAVVEHAQVLPTLGPDAELGCCVLLVEPNRSTSLSLAVNKGAEGVAVKVGATVRF